MEKIKIVVKEDRGERLDLYLASELKDLSRSEIKGLIKDTRVLVNGKAKKVSYQVKLGDTIEIEIPEVEEFKLIAEDLGLDVIYEDDYLAVINKPYGMVVHPGSGNFSGTLVNGLLYRFEKLANIEDPIRPGIVHRLDKDTSGLLVIAKDDTSYEKLVDMFKRREVVRSYKALVYGRIKEEEGTIDAKIGRHPVNRQKMTVSKTNSKEAITHYKLLELFDRYSFIEANLETGRTHQIRVHMNHINHPIVGDPVYSSGKNEFGLKRQFLHSAKVEFIHPISGEFKSFETKLPGDFEDILERLRRRRDN